MAAFARTELDLVGLARQDNQAAVQLFVDPRRQDDRPRRVPARRRPRGDRRRGAGQLPRAVLRARRRRSRARSICPPPSPRRPTSRRSWPSDGADRSTCASRSAARSASCMALATRNAAETLAREQARWLADQGKTLAALEELAEALGLPGPPLRIECYDISNFQGSESVGSMVVFEDGKPRSGEYRRFRIKTVERPERLRQPPGGPAPPVPAPRGPARRASRRRAAGRCRTSSSSTAARARSAPRRRSSTSSACTTCRWPAWPRSARSCSCPSATEPVVLPATSPALYLVQRLRDEAHRFAITYHRDLRAKPARPLGVRRPARRRPEAQARAAQGVRLDQARARGAGRADRRRARASGRRSRRGSRRRSRPDEPARR